MDALAAHALEALRLALLLAAPALVASLVVGALGGLVQTLTQVQDSSFGFVARWFAVVLTLSASAAWMSNELRGFTQRLFESLSTLS